MSDHKNSNRSLALEPLLELSVGSSIGQFRAVPVKLGEGRGRGILAAYCSEFDVDPFCEMFYFPSDTLKMILFDMDGNILWRKDLGRSVVPGLWFCPVFAFDLDGDGVDDIWFVNNIDPNHPLGLKHYRLERLNPYTGETTGQWVWPHKAGYTQSISHAYRNFILGGYVRGEPVLITAQGTYGDMFLQGWSKDMNLRWEHIIKKDDPGARGAHMCPVVDINHDGIDELMWGERCIELDSGKELFCADRNVYKGHSDIIQPVFDRKSGRWFIYTAREKDLKVKPRVVLFNDRGERVWGDIEEGHMDLNWVARIKGRENPIAMSIRIDAKTCGREGRFHYGREEFVFDALTGERLSLPFSTYKTVPVDINGDGYHEFISDGNIISHQGEILARVGGSVAMASKFMDVPGEQLLCYYMDGTIRIWADMNAQDSEDAMNRYQHPFYKTNQKLTASGSNLVVLGGI